MGRLRGIASVQTTKGVSVNTSISPSLVRRTSRKPSRVSGTIEPLERRTLMSGTWSTVNTDTSGLGIIDMAADKAGNVYAIGINKNHYATIRKEAAGQWTTPAVTTSSTTEYNS